MTDVVRVRARRAIAHIAIATLVASMFSIVALPAQAADGSASLSGTATGIATSDYGTVCAWQVDGGADIGSERCVGFAPGVRYTIDGLDAGTYVVGFSPVQFLGSGRMQASTGDGLVARTAGTHYDQYMTEWWNDRATFETAEPIVLEAGEDRDGIDADLSRTGSVTMTVATPKISGTAKVGSKLTAVAGAWTPGATLSYQWAASGAAIAGATGPSLTLTAAQLGKTISVTVSGTREGYTPASRTSVATATVAAATLTSSTPTISGAVRVGVKLTAAPGTWTAGTALSYQWTASGVAIAGATASTFTPTAQQVGRTLAVTVTGKLAGYASASRASGMTTKVAAGTLSVATPTISGTVASGSTLTAKPGAWTSGTAFTYQWFAGGTAISGATNSTYTLGSSQKGKTISVKVTGSKSGYTSVSKMSNATAKVATASTVSIVGAAAVGVTLEAVAGTWTSGTSFAYQWYADGAAITAATSPSHTVTSSQRGKQITVTVTGNKSGYATVSKTSKATTRVPTVATPKISGTATVAGTLTVSVGTWTSGTSFTYQWYANGKVIRGATASVLVPSAPLAGQVITVKVTGTKSGYTTVGKTSAATKSVSYPSSSAPDSKWTCPSWAPIKGNASSFIYHMPGQRFYDKTAPEECFRTESAAVNAGYRKSKV